MPLQLTLSHLISTHCLTFPLASHCFHLSTRVRCFSLFLSYFSSTDSLTFSFSFPFFFIHLTTVKRELLARVKIDRVLNDIDYTCAITHAGKLHLNHPDAAVVTEQSLRMIFLRKLR